MCDRFTDRVRIALYWKNNYFGAAYSTRLKAAIKDLKAAVAEAEECVELKPED